MQMSARIVGGGDGAKLVGSLLEGEGVFRDRFPYWYVVVMLSYVYMRRPAYAKCGRSHSRVALLFTDPRRLVPKSH